MAFWDIVQKLLTLSVSIHQKLTLDAFFRKLKSCRKKKGKV